MVDFEDEERPQPKGRYVRSLTNDNINELNIQTSKVTIICLYIIVLAMTVGNAYLSFYVIDNAEFWWADING